MFGISQNSPFVWPGIKGALKASGPKLKTLLLDVGVLFNTGTLLTFAQALGAVTGAIAWPIFVASLVSWAGSIYVKWKWGDKLDKFWTMLPGPIIGGLTAVLFGLNAFSMLHHGASFFAAEKPILGATIGSLMVIANSIQIHRFRHPEAYTRKTNNPSRPLGRRIVNGALSVLGYTPIWAGIGLMISGLYSAPGVLAAALAAGSIKAALVTLPFVTKLGAALATLSVSYQATNYALHNKFRPGIGRYMLALGSFTNFINSLHYGWSDGFATAQNALSIFSHTRVGQIEDHDYFNERAKLAAANAAAVPTRHYSTGSSPDMGLGISPAVTPTPSVAPLPSARREFRSDPRDRLMRNQRRDWRPGF